ncbi:MAG: 2OG-Fe(II) oxygenase [Bdellovibrionota bacterium]
MLDVEAEISKAIAGLDLARLRERYFAQGEFLFLEEFLPAPVLAAWEKELEKLIPLIHRNYLPRHKKGGSVDYATLSANAPTMRAVYGSQALLKFCRDLAGAEMDLCPPTDPHSCALYAYTEKGDHIGFHYDTSYYRGRRFTLLIGLRDRSGSKLEAHLHTREPERGVKKLEVATTPGSLVFFDGDKLYHRVTPLGEGEERFIITMQYVTRSDMNPFLRFVSNMKDSIAYFGFQKVFGPKAPVAADSEKHL